MLSLLKHLIAGKELAELSRWRSTWEEYRRWLAEFPMIGVTLDNFKNEVSGDESMDACHPPMEKGPWTVDNLRHHLRNYIIGKSMVRWIAGKGWSFEEERRGNEVRRLTQRNQELEGALKEAADLLKEKNREINQLRYICGESYQAIGDYDKLDLTKALENLRAASSGKFIPHASFIRRNKDEAC